MDRASCAACNREIDAAARLCPYCGADRRSGEKPVDTQTILQQEFQRRKVPAGKRVVEYARQRQGWVIGAAALAFVLLLAGLHQIAVVRNRTAVSNAPAVPLTDVVDLNSQSQETRTVPMPALHFQYDGNPKTMQTPIVEQGGAAPIATQ